MELQQIQTLTEGDQQCVDWRSKKGGLMASDNHKEPNSTNFNVVYIERTKGCHVDHSPVRSIDPTDSWT